MDRDEKVQQGSVAKTLSIQESSTGQQDRAVPVTASEPAIHSHGCATAEEAIGSAELTVSELTSMGVEADEIDERTLQQLRRLFDLLRVAKLNTLYYGCRAEEYEQHQRNFQIGTALLSGVATILLLLPFPTAKPDAFDPKLWATIAATVLSGVAALLGSISPYYQWGERAKQTYALHAAHKHLLARVDTLIAEIRKTDSVTPEQVRAADELRSLFVHIEASDEPKPDDTTRDRLDDDVRKAFPDDYIWTNY